MSAVLPTCDNVAAVWPRHDACMRTVCPLTWLANMEWFLWTRPGGAPSAPGLWRRLLENSDFNGFDVILIFWGKSDTVMETSQHQVSPAAHRRARVNTRIKLILLGDWCERSVWESLIRFDGRLTVHENIRKKIKILVWSVHSVANPPPDTVRYLQDRRHPHKRGSEGRALDTSPCRGPGQTCLDVWYEPYTNSLNHHYCDIIPIETL